MALDMSKYTTKMTRKLPIIFLINEKVLDSERWKGGNFKLVIADIMANLSHRSIDAVMAVVSFGDEVKLWSGFKPYEEYTTEDWPETKTSGKAVFNIGLMLVKDMLKDVDTTPDGNYDPVVIFISSSGVTPGYERELAELRGNGRFKNIQMIGVVDLVYGGDHPYCNNHHGDINEINLIMNRKIPKTLSEFAGDKVLLFISDIKYDSWCAKNEWKPTEYKNKTTWFCPILDMIKLRYSENGQSYANRICKGEIPAYEGLVW